MLLQRVQAQHSASAFTRKVTLKKEHQEDRRTSSGSQSVSQSVAVRRCYVSGGFVHLGLAGGLRAGASQRLRGGLGAAVQHLAARHRHRRHLRCHHRRGPGGERVPDEDVSGGQVHAHRAQLVPLQPRSGGRAAPADLRPGGRQPLSG